MNIFEKLFYSFVASIFIYIIVLLLFAQGVLIFDEAAYSTMGFAVIWVFVLGQILLMFH